MKTLHAFDEHRYPTGQTQEVGDRDPIPPGWTDQEPPASDGVRFTDGWTTAPTRQEWMNRPQILGPAKDRRKREARAQFEARLRRGFEFDGGQWAPVCERRQRVLELVAGINAGKGLPQGKTTIRLHDQAGGAHDLDATQLVDFAADANDLIDAAEDHLATLIGQIAAAASQADLDAIDPSTGWPN